MADEKADTHPDENLINDDNDPLSAVDETSITGVTIVKSDGSVEVTTTTTTTTYEDNNSLEHGYEFPVEQEGKDNGVQVVQEAESNPTVTPTTTYEDNNSLEQGNEFPVEQEGKDNDVQVVQEAESKASVEGPGSNASSTGGAKKKKPLSPSMQRLTAKKGSTLDASKTITGAQRQAKVDDIRKKKILEQRSKEDEKRAAVLERKKKLDEAEKQKKEALMKKLDVPVNPDKKAPMKKRYSASTSNLLQLKKTKLVEHEIRIDGDKPTGDQKTSEPTRPRSSFAKNRSSSSSSLVKTKDKVRPETKRPGTAEPSKESSKPPLSRLSLNPRPASALGVSSADRRKTIQTLPGKTKSPVKAANLSSSKTAATSKKNEQKTTAPNKSTVRKVTDKKPIDSTAKTKTASAATDASSPKTNAGTAKKNVVPKNTASPKTTAGKASGTVPKTTIPSSGPATKNAKKTTTSKDVTSKPNSVKSPKAVSEKTPTTKTTSTKTTATKSTKPEGEKNKSTKTSKTESSLVKASKATPDKTSSKEKPKSEEEAKKALAERRRQAKEEAEAKAKAEREKDEVERLRREEEEKRLAEQLKMEEEQQALLLEQLKKEEEDRRQKMIEEKEQKEKEERERVEEEQRMREDEIERKAKLELEKRQREQEKKEQELDAERIERKKRVEMIMARVSAKRNASSDSPSKEPVSPPNEDSEKSGDARLKVDDIFRSRGLGRSTEDLLNMSETEKEPVVTEEQRQQDQVENTASKNSDDSIETTPPSNDALPKDDETSDGRADDEKAVHVLPEVAVSNESEETEIVITTDQPDVLEEKVTTSESTSFSNIEENVELISENSPNSSHNASLVPADSEQIVVSNISKSEDLLLEELPPSDYENNKVSKTQNGLKVAEAWAEQKTDHAGEEKPAPPESCNDDVDIESTQISDKQTLADSNSESTDVIVTNSTNNNLIFKNGDEATIEEDLSNTNEPEQWTHFEEKMQETQPAPREEIVGEEGKLWQVMEGKVELSECF